MQNLQSVVHSLSFIYKVLSSNQTDIIFTSETLQASKSNCRRKCTRLNRICMEEPPFCHCHSSSTRIVPLAAIVRWKCSATDKRYGVITFCRRNAEYLVRADCVEKPFCEIHVRLYIQHRKCLFCNVFCTQCPENTVGDGFVVCEIVGESHWTHEACSRLNYYQCSHCFSKYLKPKFISELDYKELLGFVRFIHLTEEKRYVVKILLSSNLMRNYTLVFATLQMSFCTKEERKMIRFVYEEQVLKAEDQPFLDCYSNESKNCVCVSRALQFSLSEKRKTDEDVKNIISQILQCSCLPALLILLELLMDVLFRCETDVKRVICNKLAKCNEYFTMAVKKNLPIFARFLWLYKEDNSDDLTLLFYALSRKYWDVAATFFYYGFRERTRTNLSSYFSILIQQYCSGISLLHKAFCQLTIEAVSFLLENGVSLYELNEDNQSILHLLAETEVVEFDEPVVRSMFDEIPCGNSIIDLADVNGKTALDIAFECKNWLIIDFYCQRCCSSKLVLVLGSLRCLLSKKAAMTTVVELDFIPRDLLWLRDLYQRNLASKIFTVKEMDLSSGKERVSVPVENSVFDDEVLDGNEFTYVSVLNRPTFFNKQCDLSLACRCTGVCRESCDCMSRCPYTEDGYLTDEYIQFALDGRAGIITECNQSCLCIPNCISKVAQKGMKAHLQIFRTVRYGWGVKAADEISKGQFICEYTGDLIKSAVLEEDNDDSYLLEVKVHFGYVLFVSQFYQSHLTFQEGLYIDAKSCGNVSRFINHSCEANLVMLRVVWDTYTQHTPHICFFAKEDISKGEELTLDYGEDWWKAKAGSVLCHCNSESCRYDTIEKLNDPVEDTEE
uniref:SET domain-containing protein n=1 Tax=Syphacia muris TaxID=451379 RepID=A0A0N5A9K5_9BILA